MMIDNIINLLKSKKELSGWLIKESTRESKELYFIRRDLEMNRSKNIQDLEVTVYRDFEDKGVKYKGSSLTHIHPTMNEDEVNDALNDAIYAAQFVKNPYYPLVEPQNEKIGMVESNLASKSFDDLLNEIVEAVFKVDEYEKGSINSTEIFLTKRDERIINSLGVDAQYTRYSGALEFITNWKEDKEEIELFKHIDFGSLDKDALTNEVKEMLELSRGRAIAEKMPNLGPFNVILNGESVAQIFSYYFMNANTSLVHQHLSTAKVNESIQGEEIKGDKINIKLNPLMKGSTASTPIDEDGMVLKEISIIEDGILKSYWGSKRFSYYLGVEATGNIGNMEVTCGETPIEELKKEPYLEVISFSSFQLDRFTGNFGGEVRFAWYFDGTKLIPVSGGSVTAVITDVEGDMLFSKEQTQINRYVGPKYIKMKNVMVTGNE